MAWGAAGISGENLITPSTPSPREDQQPTGGISSGACKQAPLIWWWWPVFCSATLTEVLALIFQLTKDVEHFLKRFLATLCQMFTSCIFWVGGEMMGHALIFLHVMASLIGVGMILLNRKGLSRIFPVPFLLGALGWSPFPDYSLHTGVCLSSPLKKKKDS